MPPSFTLGSVPELIPLDVARDELSRIDEILDSDQLLIGGLAVQQYYPNRNSADIDLVCSHKTASGLIDKLYDAVDFEIENLGTAARPSWVIRETGEGQRVVYLGFKITERGDPYDYVNFDRILTRARPYRHGTTELRHIKVPIVEDLAVSKLLSLVTRLSSNPEKGKQDLKDFVNLINNKEFKGRVFLDLIGSDCKRYLITEITRLQETRDEPLFANSSPARLFDILFPSKPMRVPSPESDTVQAPGETVAEEPAALGKDPWKVVSCKEPSTDFWKLVFEAIPFPAFIKEFPNNSHLTDNKALTQFQGKKPKRRSAEDGVPERSDRDHAHGDEMAEQEGVSVQLELTDKVSTLNPRSILTLKSCIEFEDKKYIVGCYVPVIVPDDLPSGTSFGLAESGGQVLFCFPSAVANANHLLVTIGESVQKPTA
jgi:hypothetical protein